MKNEKSYAEMMKSLANSKQMKEDVDVLALYIDMVIDESLFVRRVEVLEQRINESLDKRNKEDFLSLSREYQELLKVAE
ncbi:IDEAL domain-containing protein [Priestia koreensis]|uniref:IDEAL domain-containing protein n=1 Tax=Priestia koreensis TaxID=284581 RepID=UPI003D03F8D0